MLEHDRIFSAISAHVSKYGHVELRNDLQGGTMTVIFKSHVPSEGPLVALKVYGTRNVEVTVYSAVDWRNFRRVAWVYSQALELMDCFHLIEVERADPEDAGAEERGGLRIARSGKR